MRGKKIWWDSIMNHAIHLVGCLTWQMCVANQSDVWIFWALKRVNCEIRPGRPNGPIGESKMPTSTRPKKVGPILSHEPPVRTKAQTCPSRFKRLVLQAREVCPASLRGLFNKSVRLAQQVCEACSARKGGRTSLL